MQKSTLLSYIFIVLLYSISIFIVFYLGKKFPYLNKKILLLNLLYHTFCSILWFYLAGQAETSDSYYYYYSTLNHIKDKGSWLVLYGISTKLVRFMVYPLIKYLNLSYLNTFLTFNIFGYFGIVMFYVAMSENIYEIKKSMNLLNLLIFIPGINYWTSIIGKDALIILGIGLLLYSLNNIHKRYPWLAISLVIIGNSRPYVFVMVLLALVISVFWSSVKIKIQYRFIIIIVLLLSMIPAYSLFLEQARMESIDLSSAEAFLDRRQTDWRGGSTVDITGYNPLMKVFTYLFRPLFFDANNIFMLFSSIENLLLLIVTMKIFNRKFITFIKNNKTILLRFNIIYFIIGAILLAMATPNLGTAVRQKHMVIISLFSVILLFHANINKTKQLIRQKNKK